MGSFFSLDDADQQRIAKEIGDRLAGLIGARPRWNANDEDVVLLGSYGGHPLRLTLDATFGGFAIELEPDPPLGASCHLSLDYTDEGRPADQGDFVDDGFELPTDRDDYTFFVTEHVHAGDDAVAAATTLRQLELLPDPLRAELLDVLEHDEAVLCVYPKSFELRCRHEALGRTDIEQHVRRYLHLALRTCAALEAASRLE